MLQRKEVVLKDLMRGTVRNIIPTLKCCYLQCGSVQAAAIRQLWKLLFPNGLCLDLFCPKFSLAHKSMLPYFLPVEVRILFCQTIPNSLLMAFALSSTHHPLSTNAPGISLNSMHVLTHFSPTQRKQHILSSPLFNK